MFRNAGKNYRYEVCLSEVRHELHRTHWPLSFPHKYTQYHTHVPPDKHTHTHTKAPTVCWTHWSSSVLSVVVAAVVVVERSSEFQMTRRGLWSLSWMHRAHSPAHQSVAHTHMWHGRCGAAVRIPTRICRSHIHAPIYQHFTVQWVHRDINLSISSLSPPPPSPSLSLPSSPPPPPLSFPLLFFSSILFPSLFGNASCRASVWY